MNINTIDATMSYEQLLTKLREAYTALLGAYTIYGGSKNVEEKIARIGKLFRYPIFATSAVIKIESRGIADIELIANAFSKKVSRLRLQDKEQIQSYVVEGFDKLLEVMENVHEHAKIELLKINALIRKIRHTLREVKRLKKRTIKIANNNVIVSGRNIVGQPANENQYQRTA